MFESRCIRPRAALFVTLFACSCLGPSADDEGVGPRVPTSDLPAAEWVHVGSTWTWVHPVPEDFRWNGPGTLRAAWMPAAEETKAGAVLERIELEPGGEIGRPGGLVAPRRVSPYVSGRRKPRLVLWIVADTLRADVAAREMDFALRFDERLRFTHAHAPAAWTLPSMSSMFTGLPPAALRGPAGDLIVLPSVVPTVAERAREQGFVTAAVIANPTVNHDNGFSRGFDRFTVPNYADGWDLPDATWVEEQAVRELAAFGDDDLFLLVHFMDAHDPYRDHASGARFVPPPTGPGAEALSNDEIMAMWTAYRSEARHLDRVLDRLWTVIEGRRPLDLVVFTADHGEEFLDHGGTRHGPTVLPEVTRVPLWVGGERADALARRLEREGVGPDTPVTLRDVGTLLLEPERWTPSGRATVESVVHGPPRFAWVGPAVRDGAVPGLGSQTPAASQWTMSSRWLSERPPGDDIEAWLRGQPGLFSDPSERPPDGSGATRWSATLEQPDDWSAVPDAIWLDLIEQFSGLAPGRWVFWRRIADSGGIALEQTAFDPSAWAMGPCGVSPSSSSSAEATGPCLAYLGLAAPSPFEHRPAEERWALGVRPDRLPPRGAVSWVEAPRDTEVPQDVSRTMERLRALGYIP